MPKKSLLAKITGIKKDDSEEKEKNTEPQEETTLDKIESQKSNKKMSVSTSESWVQENYEGQLSVDVYQTDNEIVIKSAVAGVEPKDLDISISNDMITIRGERKQDENVKPEDYFYQECYWGPFSRSIILPQEVKTDSATAEFKKGILIIRLPKAQNEKKIKIQITNDD